jgi:exodeoxyribonuclease VII small subunit
MVEKKNKRFEENFFLLETLAKELQSGQVSVDELVPKMRDATKAMKVCKEVLKDTRIQLSEIETEISSLLEDKNASND